MSNEDRLELEANEVMRTFWLMTELSWPEDLAELVKKKIDEEVAQFVTDFMEDNPDDE